jgi:hypothetical protein
MMSFCEFCRDLPPILDSAFDLSFDPDPVFHFELEIELGRFRLEDTSVFLFGSATELENAIHDTMQDRTVANLTPSTEKNLNPT